MQLEHRQDAERPARHAHPQPAQLDPGERDQPQHREQHHDRDAEVGLLRHEREGHDGHAERHDDGTPCGPAVGVAHLAEECRGHQDERELAELRRLDLVAAGHGDPGLGAVHRRAHREHGDEAEQGHAVEHGRVRAQLAVVKDGHAEHQQEPDDDVDELLVQVGARVAALLAQGRRGRGPDEQHSDQAERQNGREQHPVHAAQHRVPGKGTLQQGLRQRGGAVPASIGAQWREPAVGAGCARPLGAQAGGAASPAHRFRLLALDDVLAGSATNAASDAGDCSGAGDVMDVVDGTISPLALMCGSFGSRPPASAALFPCRP